MNYVLGTFEILLLSFLYFVAQVVSSACLVQILDFFPLRVASVLPLRFTPKVVAAAATTASSDAAATTVAFS